MCIRDSLKAVDDLQANPGLMPAWLPILQQYGPSLLVECENHIALSEELVSKWLARYMFRGDKNGQKKARKIARYLADDKNFRSHGRRIGRDELRHLGVKVLNTRNRPALYQAIQELYVALLVTFGGTGAYKLFENSEGAALIKVVQLQTMQMAVPTQPAP